MPSHVYMSSSHSLSYLNPIRKPKLDTEAKRQIHIVSEQKRRAIIKDAFTELELELMPLNRGRKPSKIQTLQRSVEHIRFLKGNQEGWRGTWRRCDGGKSS